jgi:hypothetical protein
VVGYDAAITEEFRFVTAAEGFSKDVVRGVSGSRDIPAEVEAGEHGSGKHMIPRVCLSD